MRLIDADALIAKIKKFCENCSRRKNGSGRIIYAIGDAPCRACGVYDVIDWIDSANEIDAIPTTISNE